MMQKTCILLLIPLNFICAEPISLPAVPPGGTVNFNVHLYNNQDARATSSTSMNNTPSATTPLFDRLHASSFSSSGNPFTFIAHHFWAILGISLMTTYGVCCYYSLQGNSYLAQPYLWSRWKNDVSLEQLLALPPSTLTNTLIQEIQCRYTTSATITDAITPLAQFLTNIQQEEEALRFYAALYGWISFLHSTRITFLDETLFATIPERLQRIAYYKNLFQTWTAQHKLEQLQRYIFLQLAKQETFGVHFEYLYSFIHACLKKNKHKYIYAKRNVYPGPARELSLASAII